LIPGIIAVLIIIFFVKDSNVEINKIKKPKLSLKAFDKNFIAYLAVVSLFTIGNSSDAFLLLRVADSLE
jgi:hypothetical protein